MPERYPPPEEAGRTAAREAARSLRGLSPELAERLPQLLEAMVAIGGNVELHALLDRIVGTAAELTGARYAAIAVLKDDGGVGEFVTHGVDESVHARIGRLPGSEGLILTLLDGGGPLLLDDLTRDPRFAGFPPGHPPMRSMVGVPIRVHGAAFGALYLTEKEQGTFAREDLLLIQVLAAEAGIAVGNARVHEAVRQQARWLDGSAELTASLLAGDTGNALAVVAEQARRLADAAAGMVLVPTPEGGLKVVAASADEPGELIGHSVPAGAEISQQLLAGEPVFVEDSSSDPRMVSPASARFGPSMVLPLASDGRVLGALVVPRHRGGAPFTLPERTLATQFAEQAALTLVLAEAQQGRERLAVYEDRDRIARDLHDLVIQRLFATGMLLEGAQRSVVEPEARSRLTRAVDELDSTIQEIRTAIFALQQGPEEAPAGLRTRVLRETATAVPTLGVRPSVVFTGPVDSRVGEVVAQHLVAALREALSNAARHARASRIEVVVDVTVRLPDGREAVRLTVADDGVGMPAEPGRRSGLRNLAQRAEALGGEVSFGAGPGGAGTTVIWEAPL
ncbi:GAF domain-containing protein [Streptomyces sp. ACA25]|uniref:GAF domain-containing sensor histidine kinase n=1 Tax=Streptomyces sp. ACA25 TaxID=3022596 RepID=UPI002307429C|nr:GAF domain-containing protein [Streptomyces sp. ACA25]MDB1086206.1 GAF domain-containing protein [Streptomyces sp. ACA25]